MRFPPDVAFAALAGEDQGAFASAKLDLSIIGCDYRSSAHRQSGTYQARRKCGYKSRRKQCGRNGRRAGNVSGQETARPSGGQEGQSRRPLSNRRAI